MCDEQCSLSTYRADRWHMWRLELNWRRPLGASPYKSSPNVNITTDVFWEIQNIFMISFHNFWLAWPKILDSSHVTSCFWAMWNYVGRTHGGWNHPGFSDVATHSNDSRPFTGSTHVVRSYKNTFSLTQKVLCLWPVQQKRGAAMRCVFQLTSQKL